MRCSNCGHEIPKGALYCKKCGQELRIVPDYNPLDDMLTAQIKVSINDKNEKPKRTTGRISDTSARRTPTPDEREARRRQAERRRELKRKKRRRLLFGMAAFLIAIVGLCILLYQTSYAGIVKKGNKALLSSEYANAQEYFEKAIDKKPEQPEAYVGLSHVYIAKGNLNNAETVFLDAIEQYSDNTAIYKACIQFYLDTNQALEIPQLLSKATVYVGNADIKR